MKQKASAKPNQPPAERTQQKLRNVGGCLDRSASSKIYYGITYVGKRQVKKSPKTTDRQLAENRLVELRAKVGNLKPDKNAKWSFHLLGTRWLTEQQHNLKPWTIRHKQDSIRIIDEVFAGKPMRNIGPDEREPLETNARQGCHVRVSLSFSGSVQPPRVTVAGFVCQINTKVITMRELTLRETGYLAGMLPLSLVLPLLMSICGPRGAATNRSCMKTVWIGQALLAVAGLAVLASASVGAYATAFGVTSCFCCTLVLLRQFGAIRPA